MNLSATIEARNRRRVIVDRDNITDLTIEADDTQSYATPPECVIELVIEFRERGGQPSTFPPV
ncbi:hypothetical protein [Paraburkholderia susongensis]|uniref:Uncharacterized protein n=1 Tax=Paraburkholderia susongensis TaxID=1515439 RepID=A0A1X7M537_9BURK|nr:hypothetical protein [Paraburkholderia susongensis]SMG61296.1 hypothetical protein SAMN06265784_12079 [Paraburkholderia susongensis]